MPALKPSVIGDRSRVAAAEWALRSIAGLAIPLDGIAALVARLLQAPIGAVSVVSGEYDDCVGAYGLPAPLTRHVPMDYSVCKYVVSNDRPLGVPDMGADPELRDHPARRDLGVAAFAGVPLRDVADRPVGALTVVDYTPRSWTPDQLAVLADVAALLGPVPTSLDGDGFALLNPARDDAPGLAPNAAVQAEIQHRFISTLLDSLQVGVLALDTNGRPVLFNRALRRVYGLGDDLSIAEAADLAGRLLYHPDGRHKAIEDTAIGRALAGEPVRNSQAVVRIPGQPERALLTNSEPIRSADGRLIGAVSAILDVTEMRRTARYREAELAVASLLNKAHTIGEVAPAVCGLLGPLVHSSYVSLWLVDPEVDVLRLGGYWSAPGLTMSDILPDHITRDDGTPGQVWTTGEEVYIPDLATSPGHVTGAAHAFAEACVARGIRTVVAVPVREGDDVLGVLSCLSGGEDSETTHIAALVNGIAGQISAFLTRRQAADLAMQLTRAKDDFVALVGHAVRTPLTSISAYTDLMCENRDLPNDTREMLHIVRRNAEALRRIVADLLDISALETGEDSLRPTDIDLVTLAEAAVEAARPAADATGTTLATDLPARLRLHADAYRLRQLLDNLIDNAVRFSPGGRVKVRARQTGRITELCVADNGIGIPDEQRHQVFNRFFRAQNVAPRAGAGTGLGLTLVQTIARAHGGSVRLAEQTGPGTTVVVRLPTGRRP